MVATHDWDLFGAKKAGFNTAYAKSKNTIFNPYYPKPDIQDDNLINLAKGIMNFKN